MIKNKSMFCIFCQQQSKIHVLSASPDLHGSFYLCLLPQARTSDLTYDVGVEVDYFESISQICQKQGVLPLGFENH